MVILVFVLILILILGGYKLYSDDLKRKEQLNKKLNEEKLISEVKEKYSEYVVTIKDSNLYVLENNKYKLAGVVSKDTVLKLDDLDMNSNDKYFKVLDLDRTYYIKYSDVSKASKKEKDNRYLNYIKLDKEIITENVTKFYLNDKIVYTINKSFTLPVYMIDSDKYYVEYNNELMYVLKNNIKSENVKNNNQEYAKEIPVITYHFFYDPDNGEVCDQSICHSKSQFTSHLDYIKDNNFFTPTMQEFYLFMEGNLRLPKKSVLITIDDGHMSKLGINLLTEYKLNGTIFLITSAYDKKYYETEYVEAHSHTDNMHNGGICPGGQGGGIKCLAQDTILNDLKSSREKLDGALALCYPFYEYNDYSISLVKQAGFKLGFAGYYASGSMKAKTGGDRYQIPRITMGSYSGVDYLKSVLN